MEDARRQVTKRGSQVVAHLVAAGPDAGPQSDEHVLGPAPVGEKRLEGRDGDSCRRSAPTSVSRCHRLLRGIHEEERETVRGLDAQKEPGPARQARIPVGAPLPGRLRRSVSWVWWRKQETSLRSEGQAHSLACLVPSSRRRPLEWRSLEAVDETVESADEGGNGDDPSGSTGMVPICRMCSSRARLELCIALHSSLVEEEGVVAADVEIVSIAEVEAMLDGGHDASFPAARRRSHRRPRTRPDAWRRAWPPNEPPDASLERTSCSEDVEVHPLRRRGPATRPLPSGRVGPRGQGCRAVPRQPDARAASRGGSPSCCSSS